MPHSVLTGSHRFTWK